MVEQTIAPAYNTICRNLLPIQVYREMIIGRSISTQEAHRKGVIHLVFKDISDLKESIMMFGVEFAMRGKNRRVMQTYKIKFHEKIIRDCELLCLGPDTAIRVSQRHKEMFTGSQALSKL